MAGLAQEYCTTCGARLIDGACAHHDPYPAAEVRSSSRPRRHRLLFGSALAIVLVVTTLSWVFAFATDSSKQHQIDALQRRLNLVTARVATDVTKASSELNALSSRISALEAAAASQLDPTTIARQSLGSVFTIEVRSPIGSSLGSSFVVASGNGSSTLITNFHVVQNVWVEGRDDVKVVQGDRSYPGTIANVSQAADLAAVKVPAILPVLKLDKALPAVGDPVIVIGSPYGLQGTVATGIVSARRDSLIQFSAPVSPGDSGGPLLSASGAVVGVTVSKVATSSAEGLSFAVPTSTVCRTVIPC